MKLILFFNGWGSDPALISDLDSDGYDVISIDSYHKFKDGNYIDLERLKGYDSVSVVAWSFGVPMGYRWYLENRSLVDQFVAINGTLKPLSSREGLPAAGCKLTYRAWSEEVRTTFNRKMFGSRTSPVKLHTRTVEDQKEELGYLYDQLKDFSYENDHNVKAIIGGRDRIFPVDNMVKFWGDSAIFMKEMPHYPFGEVASWRELFSLLD